MLKQNLLRASCLTLCILLSAAGTVSAANLCGTYADPENYTWTADWTDSFGETTYTMEAPCKVFVTVPFTITVSASDSLYPSAWVGGLWGVQDTPAGGSASTLASGFSIWLDTAGNWSQTIPVTYTGLPVDHTVLFSFTDFGQGSGSHNFSGSAIGDIVVDPYPVPEPESAFLLLLGLSCLVGRRCRMKRRNVTRP